jgi:hypothetical protein
MALSDLGSYGPEGTALRLETKAPAAAAATLRMWLKLQAKFRVLTFTDQQSARIFLSDERSVVCS